MLLFPQPDTPDPPGLAFQVFVCILVTFTLFEMVVFALPEKWRDRIYDLQFGASWATKRKGGE